MNDVTISQRALANRTPEVIAVEINSIKDQTRKMVLYNSIEIGRRLIEAKQLLPHGEWGNWLEDKVDYSQSTANNLMKIFKEYGSEQITLLGDNAKSQALGNLSYTQAVALLGVPEDEREAFVKENDIDNMSTRELQQVIKERDEAIKKAEEEKKIAEEKNRLYETVSKSYEKLEKTNHEHYEKAEKLSKELEKLKEKLAEAESSGNAEEVNHLMDALEDARNNFVEANKKIVELEQQLKEKPLNVTVADTVEKIPDEVQKELEQLRKGANPTALKFKMQFDDLVRKFGELLGTIGEFKDEETLGRYKRATKGLIEKMLEKL